MIRLLQIGSVALVAVAALLVFHLKFRAETVADNVTALQARVDSKQEDISLLKAEWSFLTQPARIQDLVQRHQTRLRLSPLNPEQVMHIDMIPARPVGLVSAESAPLSSDRVAAAEVPR